MRRVPDLDEDALSPAQRAVYERIAAGPRGKVEGPLRVWLTSPELADRAQALGAFCRYQTGLPRRLSELAILVTGAFWRAAFEWHVHAPVALEAGLSPRLVEAIRRGERPEFVQEDEAIVYEFSRELLENRRVAEPTYRRAVEALGLQTVVELVGLLGYYGLISMTIVAFEVPLPPGAPNPFADPADGERDQRS